jgi:murein DD-endopeptidase MepM/ murein hydrolase activator NlpD
MVWRLREVKEGYLGKPNEGVVMKGKIALIMTLALASVSSHVTQLAYAAPVNDCEDLGLNGELLTLCQAYVHNDCLNPQRHDLVRCVYIRRTFREKSGGVDLDELLTEQNSTRVLVPATGGSVTLPGIGTATFPSGAFTNDTYVEIASGSSPSVNSVFNEFASIFRPANRLDYEIIVATGAHPPVSETIDIRLSVPESFRTQVPANYGIDLFAMVEQASDLDLPFRSFELFESQLTPDGAQLTASIPTGIFFLDSDGQYKAIFTLAPTPGTKESPAVLRKSALAQLNSDALSTSNCEAVSIACPVEGGCDPTSTFRPARRHPVTGEVRPHYGVDYRAATGTPIYAAASGSVERSYTSTSYGETVIIRHNDGGATLYAHLQRRDVGDGDTIAAGQLIGTANSTGLSSGPHLHLEYVPNGEIIRARGRIDPDACVNGEGSGSVTVSDSGTIADDAFEAAIDGFSIGQTQIGASNTLEISNLRSGEHTLALTVLIAPDNAGTYTVQLSDGLVFTDGSTSKTGTAAQGATVSWQFMVP